MAKRIQLSEAQLKRIIKEALEKTLEEIPEEPEYSDFTGVINFLTPTFDSLGWEYIVKPNENRKWAFVYFKHKIGMSDCRRLCAEINAKLEWSKFSDYTCRWGITEHKHIFHLTIYKKSQDNQEQ